MYMNKYAFEASAIWGVTLLGKMFQDLMMTLSDKDLCTVSRKLLNEGLNILSLVGSFLHTPTLPPVSFTFYLSISYILSRYRW